MGLYRRSLSLAAVARLRTRALSGPAMNDSGPLAPGPRTATSAESAGEKGSEKRPLIKIESVAQQASVKGPKMRLELARNYIAFASG